MNNFDPKEYMQVNLVKDPLPGHEITVGREGNPMRHNGEKWVVAPPYEEVERHLAVYKERCEKMNAALAAFLQMGNLTLLSLAKAFDTFQKIHEETEKALEDLNKD